MTSPSTILFAGGGTGGHIFPSLAVVERLREKAPHLKPYFLVSQRPLDAEILNKHTVNYTPLPVQPLTLKPWRWPGFFQAWSDSVAMAHTAIAKFNITAVVAMGGYVSAPAVTAGKKLGLPVALVNLDAVPGKANRMAAGKATKIFTVYESSLLPGAEKIGLPLRQAAIGPADKAAARRQLGLDPERETLLITGASQGAASLNQMMVELVAQHQARKALAGWQVLHLCGAKDVEPIAAAYQQAQISAKVLPFSDQMGLVWSSTSIAISRAGAGSVAEAWANAVPTIFFPYPYHKDQHQKLNAEPLTRTGSAYLMEDRIAGPANARQLQPRLLALMSNSTQRYQMAEQLRATRPADGASVIAEWLARAGTPAPD